MPENERPSSTDPLKALLEGEIDIVGQIPWSSNATFLVNCTIDKIIQPGVYKPMAGEGLLWDFPEGIYRNEVAAWIVSQALGWELVPHTVERYDAPYGIGSIQRAIDADFDQHYFTLLEDESHHERLKLLCAFDVITNNADRKSGHCLIDSFGKIWGIDHGLCFHEEEKLRTVIWEFAGESLKDQVITDLYSFSRQMPDLLDSYLAPSEIAALARRAEELACEGRLPHPPPSRRNYPWPLV